MSDSNSDLIISERCIFGFLFGLNFNLDILSLVVKIWVTRTRPLERAPPPPNLFEGPKVPSFVMKSALFLEANVAVNTTIF